MDFKGFLKVHDDDDKAIMRHPKGHEITIAKQGLSYKLRRHLKELPLHQQVPKMADGGKVPDSNPISQGFTGATGLASLGIKPKYLADGGEVAPEPVEVVPQSPEQTQAAQQVNPIGADNGMPEQQVPAPMPNSSPYEAIPGFKEAQEANNLGQAINQNTMQAQQQAIQTHIAAAAKSDADFKSHQQELMQNIQQTTKDIGDGHINPNHLMQNTSIAGKIGLAVGMILSGYGTQGHGPNPALQFLNQQIDRDVEAQKAELGNKHTLLSAYQKQYGDNVIAENMTKATLASRLSDQLSLAATQDGSAKAKQAALMAQSQLLQQYGPLVNQAAARRMSQQVEGNNGQPGNDQQTGAYLQYLRQVDPKKAEEVEKRYIPTIGIASIPVPEKARDEITTRKALGDALKDLNSFAQNNSGTLLNREVVNQGKAKAALVQDLYRRANGQGVFREAEADFVKSIIDQDPTKLFGSIRTQPKYQEAISSNLGELNNKLKSYGLPESKGAEQYKTVNGIKYMRGPNGEAIKVN